MAYQRKRPPKKTNRARLLVGIILAVVVLAAGSFVAWKHFMHHTTKAKTVSQQQSSTDNGKPQINYNPPTTADKQDNNQHKDTIVQQQQQAASNPPATSGTVTPQITYAGEYNGAIEVSSIVPSIVESGGTCTLTATLGTSKITKQVTALQNAQDTSCPTFEVAKSEFTPTGNWTISVSYSSSKYSGTSKSQTLTVK